MTLWCRPPRNDTVTSLDCNQSKDKRSNALSTDWLISKEAQNFYPDRLTLLTNQMFLRVEWMLDPFKGERRRPPGNWGMWDKEGCGRRIQKGKRTWKFAIHWKNYLLLFFFFFKKPGLALSAATELRQYKLSGGPVLREVVLKEEIREKYTIRSVYFQAPSD